jgi:hypothetical protein
VAHYTFDDCTARDLSGHGYDGVIHGAPTCVSGPRGGALRFNGTTDFIQIAQLGTSSQLRTAVTVTGWVKALRYTTTDHFITILTNGNSASLVTPFSVVYIVDASGNLKASVRFTGAGNQVFIRNLTGVAGAEDAWTFFAWTFDAGTIRIYRDGLIADSVSTGFAELARTTLPSEIARDLPGVTEFLIGTLDDIRVYDGALSGSAISSLYGNGPGI